MINELLLAASSYIPPSSPTIMQDDLLGNIQILRNPHRGSAGVSQMITKGYGGGHLWTIRR